MTKWLILFTLLFTGCSGTIHRSQLGIGSTGPILRALQSEGEYTSGISGGALIGPTFDLNNNWSLDLLAGPTMLRPLHDSGNRGELFSLDIAPRLRYTDGEWEPYGGFFIGPAYMADRWDEQGTDWGFVLGLDIGVRKKWTDEYWITFGYRAWHESNGSKVFGHNHDNPGYNMSMLMIGLEW